MAIDGKIRIFMLVSILGVFSIKNLCISFKIFDFHRGLPGAASDKDPKYCAEDIFIGRLKKENQFVLLFFEQAHREHDQIERCIKQIFPKFGGSIPPMH